MKLKLILIFILIVFSGFSQSVDLGDSTKPVRMGYNIPLGFELIKKTDSISVFNNEDKATISVTIGDTVKSSIEVGFIGALKLVQLKEEHKNLQLLHLDYSFTIDSKQHLFAAFEKNSEQRLYILMTRVHNRLIVYKFKYQLVYKEQFEEDLQGLIDSIRYFD